MGSRTLYGVQYGKETTHTTPVAADTILYCRATLPASDRDVHVPQVSIGKRTSRFADRAFARRILVDGLVLEDADGAYFEMLPLMFSMCLVGSITSTEQTTDQDDYLWTFTSPQTGAETVDSITLEIYDDTQGYEVGYCLARTVTITIDCTSDEVHVSGNLFGTRILQAAKTGLTAFLDVEFMHGRLARVYVDASYASLGSTELANALINAEVVISGGVHPKMLGSASRLMDAHGQDEIAATVVLTLERTDAVANEELLVRPIGASYDPTMRAVRLAVTGDQIGTGDSQTLQMDFIGIWTEWQALAGDVDGNTYDVATLTLAYDDTSGSNPLVVNVTTTVQTI